MEKLLIIALIFSQTSFASAVATPDASLEAAATVSQKEVASSPAFMLGISMCILSSPAVAIGVLAIRDAIKARKCRNTQLQLPSNALEHTAFADEEAENSVAQ